MTIKKLTVAAAIAVGIATCSFSSAMAACPCNNNCPMVGGACPMSGCQPLVTPNNAPCPICGQEKASCGCPTPACGCNTDPCCPKPACPEPCCTKQPDPVCASGPNTSCAELDMKQVYAYPSALYGSNNYVGQQTNAIYSTETAWMLDSNDALAASQVGLPSSTTVANGCGCNTGCAAPLLGGYGYGFTGGAAPLNYGVPSGCGCHSACDANGGVPVSRGCNCKCKDCGCGPSCGCGCESPTGAAAPLYGYGAIPIINEPLGFGSMTGGAAPCGCGCQSSCPTTIGTCNSIQGLKRSFSLCPITESSSCAPCGAAAPLVSVFPDVPDGYWAGCDIDRLASTNVIAGYPDRTFKPALPVSRAEFASMMVKGFNLNLAGCDCLHSKTMFKDVPRNHWANPAIAKAVEDGIMCGYSNGKFLPKHPVSRAEALTAMAHGINCDIDACKAKSILSQYCDGDRVPDWAQIPVAKALETGVLKNSPSPTTINPCKDASRADIASMLQTVRIAAGYDKDPTPTAGNNCPCATPVASSDCGCTKKTYMETEECVKIPTLSLKFSDEINAKSSHVGKRFAAKTTEAVTINGKSYPCGSIVRGKIVEVIRPSGCQKGGLKLAFTSIEGCDGCKMDLPKQVLTAQVNCNRTPNFFAKLIAAPFTFVGTIVGTTGRTVGGAISNLGNAGENIADSTGIAFGDVLQGPCVWPAAGRSAMDAVAQTIEAPVDVVRTAIAGATGLLQTSGDEVAYLIDSNGNKISAVNPRESVTIAFGAYGK